MIDLQPLKDSLVATGGSKWEQVIALISFCLEEGLTDGKEVVRVVSELGYSAQFVGIQLSKNEGSNPDRYRWQKLADGTYRLH